MKCYNCNTSNIIKGNIEGIVFLPISRLHKTITKGIYGFETSVCKKCGLLINLYFDKAHLSTLMKLIQNKNLLDRNDIIMKCISCGNSKLIEGSLEGMYFMPSKDIQRGLLKKPVHHPLTKICLDCGVIQNINFHPEEIKKSIKDVSSNDKHKDQIE